MYKSRTAVEHSSTRRAVEPGFVSISFLGLLCPGFNPRLDPVQLIAFTFGLEGPAELSILERLGV